MIAQNSFPNDQINPGNAQGATESINLGIHHHICWTSDSSLDWKPFPTKQEAVNVADHIKKPQENYTIVERDEECERCKEFKLKALLRRH